MLMNSLEFLMGVISHQDAGDAVLREVDKICEIIPEFAPCLGYDQGGPWHCYDVFTHTAMVVDYCNRSGADYITCMAAFFHDIAKPHCAVLGDDGRKHFHGHGAKSADMATPILNRIGVRASDAQKILQLIRYHDLRIIETREFLDNLLSTIGTCQFQRLLVLRRADVMAQSDYQRQPRLDKIDRIVTMMSRSSSYAIDKNSLL